MWRTIITVSTVAVVGLLVGTAHANQPFKGKSIKANLMTAYEPCTAPDTVTGDAVPACSTPVRSDPLCGFGGGQGKVQLKMLTVGKVGFRVKIQKVDSGCEGQTLSIVATLRRTGAHCGGPPCTTVDIVETPITTCVVQNTVCQTNGQVTFPGGSQNGQIEVKDLAVKRGSLRTFDVGIVNNN